MADAKIAFLKNIAETIMSELYINYNVHSSLYTSKLISAFNNEYIYELRYQERYPYFLLSFQSDGISVDIRAMWDGWSEIPSNWNRVFFLYIDPSLMDTLQKKLQQWVDEYS